MGGSTSMDGPGRRAPGGACTAVKPGARSAYDVAVQWWSASVVAVTVPRAADEDAVHAVMDSAARAEGRTVASTYRLGPRLVGWCPLAVGPHMECAA